MEISKGTRAEDMSTYTTWREPRGVGSRLSKKEAAAATRLVLGHCIGRQRQGDEYPGDCHAEEGMED